MDSSTKRPKPNLRGSFLQRSFRSRLSLSVVLLVIFAVASTTIFTIYRTNLTNSFLATQISESVQKQAENELTSIVSRHAKDLDNFFISVSNNMETLGASIQLLLKSYSISGTSSSVPANLNLTRLPQGSWDNPNNEPGSIFVPEQEQLPDSLLSELNNLKQLDTIAPSILKKNPDMVALYFGSLEGETVYYPNIDLSAILPPDFDITQRPWFIAANPNQNPSGDVVWSAPYQDAALHGLVVTTSLPVIDDISRFRGVIAVDVQLTQISDLVSTIRFSKTGYAFLLDNKGRIITMPESGYSDLGLTMSDFQGETALEPILGKVPLDVFQLLTKMTTSQNGVRQVVLNGVEKYVAYQPIPSVGYSLAIVVPVSETQATLIATREKLATESRRTLLSVIASTILLLVAALLISRWMGNTLAKPLMQLTDTATRLSMGDLSIEAKIQTGDEIGVLAKTFNTMTSRLRNLIESLEQRVAERTADLEQANKQNQKRADQLQVVSDVARAVSTEVDLEKLLELVTEVVSNRFGFYHVGVFLLDPVNKTAVLRASNSPGGKRMVTRKHSLAVGQVGIVGFVTASGEPRIALDVGEDADYFSNPDLPETRSEMTLPLKVRGRIIGALDVQSTQAGAFTSADAETLSILADQVAIAIENARLFAESSQALVESKALYGEYIRRTWEKKTAQSVIGYQHSAGAGTLIEKPVTWDEIEVAIDSGKTAVSGGQDAPPAVAVPIQLQNQVIGILDVRSTEPDRVWTRDEVAVIEDIAERLGLALENARMFEETSSRASREHVVAEITSRIRETNDPQAMIRTTIEELQRALNVSRVEIIPQVVSAHLPGRENDDREP
jgi:GAF domain-containing protein/HAMP domain-containing protein